MTSTRDLVGRWVHIFEEDTERGAVYRREGEDVPLSRRPRERLEFEEDGTGRVLVGGADDRLQAQPATWSREGDDVVLRLTKAGSKGPREYRVVERSADRLLIRT
jgi:hypothetical protein